ncbi:MAG: LCCL domain-containing protein [Devosia sp.]|nr:LCCL domain-containing protein [Devosia sp.]
MRRLRPDTICLATFLFLFIIVGPASSQQPLTSPRLTELLAEEETLLAETEELGGSRLPADAIINAQGEVYELRQLINTFEEVATGLELTQDELRAMQREAEAMSTEPGGSKVQKTARKTAETIAKRFLAQAVKRIARVIGIVADATEEALLNRIKSETVATLREYVRRGQLQQREVSQLLRAAYFGIAVAEKKRKRLQAIQERTRAIFGEVAVERQRLAALAKPATGGAVLTPDLDAAGDEEERDIYNEEGIVPAGNTVVIDWYRDDLGLNSIDTYQCPPNPDRIFSNASLVGTDRYLTKSPVCVAAAHAGVISVELGGRLRLRFFAGQDDDEYHGSLRNGIKSGSWNRNWGGFSIAPPY